LRNLDGRCLRGRGGAAHGTRSHVGLVLWSMPNTLLLLRLLPERGWVCEPAPLVGQSKNGHQIRQGPFWSFFSEDDRRLGGLLEEPPLVTWLLARPTRPFETESCVISAWRSASSSLRPGEHGRAVPSSDALVAPGSWRDRLARGAIARPLDRTHSRRAPPTQRCRGATRWPVRVCDDLLAAQSETLLAQLNAFPCIPVAPHQDGPNARRHIEQTLELSRRARAESAGSTL
jgi:hypothetical protein